MPHATNPLVVRKSNPGIAGIVIVPVPAVVVMMAAPPIVAEISNEFATRPFDIT